MSIIIVRPKWIALSKSNFDIQLLSFVDQKKLYFFKFWKSNDSNTVTNPVNLVVQMEPTLSSTDALFGKQISLNTQVSTELGVILRSNYMMYHYCKKQLY